jgi:hypothetical protein
MQKEPDPIPVRLRFETEAKIYEKREIDEMHQTAYTRIKCLLL